MNLKKGIAALAILGLTSLFAADLSSVDKLVGDINATKDAKQKAHLMQKLDDELFAIDKKELPKAQEIVNKKLIITK